MGDDSRLYRCSSDMVRLGLTVLSPARGCSGVDERCRLLVVEEDEFEVVAVVLVVVL